MTRSVSLTFLIVFCISCSGVPEGNYDLEIVMTYPSSGDTDVSEYPRIAVTFNYRLDAAMLERGDWSEFFVYRITTDTGDTTGWENFTSNASCPRIEAHSGGDSIILIPPIVFPGNAFVEVRIKKWLESADKHRFPLDYTFNFVVENDSDPPSVSYTIPADGATLVEPDTRIVLRFDDLIVPLDSLPEIISIDPPTDLVLQEIDSTCFTAVDELVYLASDSLQSDSTYTVTVKTGISDYSGNISTAQHSFSFTIRP